MELVSYAILDVCLSAVRFFAKYLTNAASDWLTNIQRDCGWRLSVAIKWR